MKTPAMLTYALAVFTGAFLLFAVQPLIGKYILPWFGGSPEVWTTCMLFFQTLLLAGYAYAHASFRLLRPRAQALLHGGLLLAAAASLPIGPSPRWVPQGTENPTAHILLLLGASLALPYLVLASTSPLLQGWWTRLRPGKAPYRLYALSNAGSLLALGAYPLLVEPLLSRRQQALGWSIAWGIFAVLTGLCALVVWRSRDRARSGASEVARGGEGRTGGSPGPGRRSTLGRRALWVALPAAASVVLLAVTNVITLDLAAIPLLWVLPLGVYLLSFVLCFQGGWLYPRRACIAALIVTLVAVIWLRADAEVVSAAVQVPVLLTALLACCMVCHGELYRLRPGPSGVTGYYLSIAAGGAVGGVFVAVVAPLVFTSYLELPLGLLGGALFAILADADPAVRRRRWLWATLIVGAGGVAVAAEGARGRPGDRVVHQSRDFYGVLTVWERGLGDPRRHRYVLQHGTTIHGVQLLRRRDVPTAYYGIRSGVGLTLRALPEDKPRRIGVVGLGAGTLAAYGRRADTFRFYEINPQVKHLAETRFTYLSDSPARVEVVLGDARLRLGREPPQNFDMLVLDAFSSDAVPVHLLTKEAFQIYLRHLRPEGVLAVHISSVHLDLHAVIFRLAEHFGLPAVQIGSDENPALGVLAADWILLTRNRRLLADKHIAAVARRPDPADRKVSLWTDDRVNLLEVVR